MNDLEEQDNVQIETEKNRFIQSENEGKTERYSSVQWPTIGEFTDEKIGLDKINEYIEKVMLTTIICFFFLESHPPGIISPIMHFKGMENIVRWSRFLLVICD